MTAEIEHKGQTILLLTPEPQKGQIWEHCRESLLLEVTSSSMIPGMTYVKILGKDNVIFHDRIWTDKLHREWNLSPPPQS